MNRFTIPRDIYYGHGALEILKTLEGKRAVLVIGGGSVKASGKLAQIESMLAEAGIETRVIEGIISEPTVAMVMEGVKALNEFQPDWVIGIGGGSPMDAAKAMWVFYEHPQLTFEEASRPFTMPKLRTKANSSVFRRQAAAPRKFQICRSSLTRKRVSNTPSPISS
ncbi:iron-containing alcohol dehydrogenase [Paenibacillus naphthalenovorans]|uniref:iron-containing alcohol dehydrogenase n=1 Tax=Paenibacillus naphthalenovorans TaxID=162209 RepID=UPI003D2CF35E